MSSVVAIPTVRNPNIFNLHVSTNYVRPWGEWHAIREFFQNLYDACLHIVHNNPGNLDVADTREGNQFIFTDNTVSPPASIGMVDYNETSQTLIITNELRDLVMTTRCLLLGGSDHPVVPDAPVAGEFGEGFKLAILALLRRGRSVCIVVGRDKWKFFLREDPAFHNEVCLWVEIMKNVEDSTKVQVTIEGIPMVDYMKARRRLLLITDRDPHRLIPTTNGLVLFDEEYRGHMHVKGIWVSENPYGYRQSLGYDAFQLKLDRDRMAFQDPNTFMAHTSQIAGETLVHYMNNPGSRGIALDIVRRIYSAISGSDLGVLFQYINPAVASLFWDKFAEFHPNCQPMSIHQPNDDQNRPYYSIAIKFPRLYVSVDYYLLQILKMCTSFRSPCAWLAETINRAREQYPEADQQQVAAAIQVVQAMPDLNLDNIAILQNDVNHNYISCVHERCLYIPRGLVDREIVLLEPLGPPATPLTRALQLLAIRCQNSDYCVQL